MVEFARLKRQSFKGIVDIVYGGEKPVETFAHGAKDKQGQKGKANKNQNGKRPGGSLECTPLHETKVDKPVSKRQEAKNKKAKIQVGGEEKQP